MKNKKIVFIIPGFRQKITQKGYKHISKLLKSEGYYPIPIEIPWKQTTIEDNTKFFLKKYKERITMLNNAHKEIFLLGFSYGAIIAFLASTKISVKGLILCSLSPFFKEDLPKKLSKNISSLQIKRMKCFAELKSNQIARKTKARKIMMLYGAKESKPLIARVIKTFHQIPLNGKYLVSVRNVQHNISDIKYTTAIHYAAKTFL